uniref:Cadherin domain-containing protein n=1 Tax=Heterorhabditis bacteriophora TaxID=37862 RepID=A0A1I7WK37_HETBA
MASASLLSQSKGPYEDLNYFIMLPNNFLEFSYSWTIRAQLKLFQSSSVVINGGLIVKLFRRKALLDEKIDLNPHPRAYNIKLNIPKKTRIFIDQTVREREHAVQINQTYQKDLFLIKHHTTSAFAHLSITATDTVSTNPNEPVDITVDVNGFGPSFRLIVKLSCSSKNPLYNMWLSIVFNPSLYQFDTTLIPVSVLMPGHFYTFTSLVECLTPEKGLSEDIRVLLIRDDRPTPIVTAIVTMPISEVSLLD